MCLDLETTRVQFEHIFISIHEKSYELMLICTYISGYPNKALEDLGESQWTKDFPTLNHCKYVF